MLIVPRDSVNNATRDLFFSRIRLPPSPLDATLVTLTAGPKMVD